MQLKTLTLRQFRSYTDTTFRFNKNLTIITGQNGAGKTNLLEGVYTLATTRSFRVRDNQLVQHGADWYSLEGVFNSLQAELAFTRSPRSKKLTVNKKPLLPQKYIGRVPVVLFEPNSQNIITGAPQDRRRFLNRVLATSDPVYLKNILQYRRTLKQRNALLRSRNPTLRQEIFAWDIKLVELASAIVAARQQLADYFDAGLSKLYSKIAGQENAVSISYQLQVSQADYSTSLLELLQSRLELDVASGSTSAGPHRDDLQLLFDTKTANSSASRGEGRTMTLALKLLELQYLESVSKEKPILLFDDVFSELDESRRRFLLERLKGYQTIITATDIKGLSGSLPKGHAMIKLKRNS